MNMIMSAGRRGKKLFRHTPEGEEIVEAVHKIERIRIGGRVAERALTRKEKIPDNDLPIIAEKYREFRREQDGC